MTEQKLHDRMRIGSLWFDSLTFDEALQEICRLVEAGAGGSVLTPNIDHVVSAEIDRDFRAAHAAANLSLVDGQPLVWASRLLGAPLPERIAGSDLVLPLMKRAAQEGWRVYLLGGKPGVAEEAAAVLSQNHGVKIAGFDSPMISARPNLSADDPVVKRIKAARPDIVLVALGAPKQELWIHQAVELIRPAVALGLGAVLDFISGRVRRAPRWMSRAGLEWLFRLAQEPRRLWRRYLVSDPKFLFILYRTLRSPRQERIAAGTPL